MSILKRVQPQYIKKTVAIPPRVLHCASCGRDTRHAYNRNSFLKRIYVCLCCGNERSA